MQPYGSDSQDDKGLFTFYRQQQEAQKGLKNKINADHLKKILGKVLKVSQEDKKKRFQECQKQKPLASDRQHSIKKQNTFQIKSSSLSKRQQLMLKKSVIEEPKSVKPSKEHKFVKNLNHTMNNSTRQSIINDEDPYSNESFHRYLSDFDTLKLKKKPIFQEYQSSHQNPVKKSESPSPKKTNENKVQQQENTKLILHFKKMALEPQEFNGLTEINKKFVPLGLHKRQKSELKSYRKQRLKAQELKQATKSPMKHQRKNSKEKFQFFDKQSIKNVPIAFLAPEDRNTKLIRVQKIAKKSQTSCDIDGLLLEQNKQGEVFPKAKLNLPQISCRYREINGPSMSLQLQKSNELISKYQIRALEKQDENIVSLNEKLRSQLRNIKASPKQLKHHISMNYSPPKEENNTERQLSSTDRIEKSQTNSIERLKFQELYFKKQKQIFCKRDEYLKGHTKKMKRNLFSLQKSEQSKIRCLMEEKKRVMIQSLMDKLTFA